MAFLFTPSEKKIPLLKSSSFPQQQQIALNYTIPKLWHSYRINDALILDINSVPLLSKYIAHLPSVIHKKVRNDLVTIINVFQSNSLQEYILRLYPKSPNINSSYIFALWRAPDISKKIHIAAFSTSSNTNNILELRLTTPYIPKTIESNSTISYTLPLGNNEESCIQYDLELAQKLISDLDTASKRYLAPTEPLFPI